MPRGARSCTGWSCPALPVLHTQQLHCKSSLQKITLCWLIYFNEKGKEQAQVPAKQARGAKGHHQSSPRPGANAISTTRKQTLSPLLDCPFHPRS